MSKSKTNPKSNTWILLRGWGREKIHWGEFPEKLQKALSGQKVLMIDLPGAGDYYTERSPMTISGIRNFVLDKIKDAGVESPFSVLAVSLGGMIAIDLAINEPEKIDKMVIINSSFASLSPIHRRLKPSAFKHLLRIARGGDQREREVLRMISNSFPQHEKYFATWTEAAQLRPVSKFNYLSQLLAAATYSPPKKRLEKPILWLLSLGDRMVHPECTEKAHAIYGGRIERHPWGGHDLTLDDPDWVVDKVQQVL